MRPPRRPRSRLPASSGHRLILSPTLATATAAARRARRSAVFPAVAVAGVTAASRRGYVPTAWTGATFRAHPVLSSATRKA